MGTSRPPKLMALPITRTAAVCAKIRHQMPLVKRQVAENGTGAISKSVAAGAIMPAAMATSVGVADASTLKSHTREPASLVIWGCGSVAAVCAAAAASIQKVNEAAFAITTALPPGRCALPCCSAIAPHAAAGAHSWIPQKPPRQRGLYAGRRSAASDGKRSPLDVARSSL